MRTLPLERFARVSADLAFATDRGSALRDEGLDEGVFAESQSFWFRKMADESERGRRDLALRFAALFAARQRELATKEASANRQDHRFRAVERVHHEAPQAPPVHPAYASSGPFRAAAYQTRLTLEQFAAMRAELVSSEESGHAAIRDRFGLDDALFVLEERAWQERFATDPDLFKSYVPRFQYYRGLFQRRS